MVNLRLPCIRFEVRLLPSDPSKPTFLELAALHFIHHPQPASSVLPRDLERFLGLGTAVFQDMLIRMVNRGWVRITSPGDKLILSELAADSIVHRRGQTTPSLPSTEEGKAFWLCYDLLGGGFAVIPPRLLAKTHDNPETVPRRPPSADEQTSYMPYSKPFDGFLSFEESREARILQALQGDRFAREYLQRIRSGHFPHLRVERPPRRLTLSDVEFYPCAFEVYSSSDDGRGPASIPILECVEPRNIAVRRLGELNAERIVEYALAAERSGDERLIKLLAKNKQAASSRQFRSSDPLDGLLEQLRQKDDDLSLEEILDRWPLAIDRIDMLLASRLDFEGSRTVAPDALRGAAATLIDAARNRLVLSSPHLRIASAEASTDEDAALQCLARASRKGDIRVFVHGTQGSTGRGTPLSDEAAINRVVTSLGSAAVHLVDPSLDHVRTPFLAADGDGLLWQTTSLLGDRQGPGLMLRLLPDGHHSSVRRIGHVLPADMREKLDDRTEWRESSEAHARPADVARSLRTAQDLLDRLISEWTDLESRKRNLEELTRQLSFLRSWLSEESNSVELVAAASIRDRATSLLGPETDAQPVIVGIAGRGDSRAYTDLIEEISHRLSRQDLSDIAGTSTLVCLPEGPEFDFAAEGLLKRIGSAAGRFEILRQRPRTDRLTPTSFILTPTSALLAQDGLVRFVPTIGRKVKGRQVGVQLHGAEARSLAASFLAGQWVDCAARLVPSAASAPVPRPAMSRLRREQLHREAQRGRWFDDGNRGATGARRFIEAAEESRDETAAECVEDAKTLRASADPEDRQLGYALMKGAAALSGESAAEAAAEIARTAAANGNLLVTAILADHLADGSIHRDPLTRKLAFCAALQTPPALSADDGFALCNPTPAVQALACLLMLDGVDGDLSAGLAGMDPGLAGERAELTRAIAAYALQRGGGIIELIGEDLSGDPVPVETTVGQIRAQIEAGRTATAVGLVIQVRELRELLFEKPGSFPADLLQFLSERWLAMPAGKRLAALKAFFARAKADLGIDLFHAVESMQRVKPERLAEDYFQRKNRQMQQQTGYGAVQVHLSGRFLLNGVRKIITLLVDQLIPEMLSRADDSRRALGQAIAKFLAGQASGAADEQVVLDAMLRARLLGGEAGRSFIRRPWELPSVPNMGNPDWRRLRQNYLQFEFKKGTAFAQVVDWFLNHDSHPADDGRTDPQDLLVRLVDLLESAQKVADPSDMAAADRAVTAHLMTIGKNAGNRIADAAGFARAAELGDGVLPSAIVETERALNALKESLGEGDVQGAVICAGELRKLLDGDLQMRWEEASARVRQKLVRRAQAPTVAAEIGQRLDSNITAEDLDQARTYLDLAETLGRVIPFDRDCQLYISERGVAPADSPPLVMIVAGLRAKVAAPPRDEVLEAVLAFFSNLDSHQLTARISQDAEGWCVNASHPDLAALGFGMSKAVDIRLPSSREAEYKIRKEWRTKRESLLWGGDRPGAKPSVCEEIVLSPFNVGADGVPVLSWRKLAQLGALGARDRRIGALADLSSRRFSASGSRFEWWSALDEPARADFVSSILGVADSELKRPITKVALAGQLRDLCLALGLFLETRGRGEKLHVSQSGAFQITRLWRAAAPAGTADAADRETALMTILERIIEAAH